MALKRGFRHYRGWIAAGVLATVAFAGFVLARQGSSSEQAVTYETETASLGTISVTVSGTGNVEVDGTTEVYPDAAGTVATVAITEDSIVATGDVLFTLEADDAEAATARALASLRQAQQSVTQATLQLDKAESALAALEARSAEPSSTVNDTEIASAEAEVAAAEASISSAKAQAVTASLDYDDAVAAEDDLSVTAPCSGVVYSLGIEVGDTVSTSGAGSSADSAATGGMTGTGTSSTSSSSAPVVLAPEQPLAVHLTVNEVDLPSVALGQRADLEFDALPDVTATGKVYEIAEEGSNSSGVVTFDVWLSIDVADEALRAGMSAAATIVTDVAKDALIVSNSAVHSDGDGGYYVLVMTDGTTTPAQVAVTTGLASATQTQVLSGLAEGDVVVTQTVDPNDTDSGTSSEPPGGGVMMPGMGGGFRD